MYFFLCIKIGVNELDWHFSFLADTVFITEIAFLKRGNKLHCLGNKVYFRQSIIFVTNFFSYFYLNQDLLNSE